MRQTTTKRVGVIRGKGIKKRCRKETDIWVEALGDSDEHVREKLKGNLARELSKYRTHSMKEWFECYDVQVTDCEGYQAIQRPLFPDIKPEEYRYRQYDVSVLG